MERKSPDPLLLIVLAAAAAGGWWYYSNQQAEPAPCPGPNCPINPTPAPDPTPKPKPKPKPWLTEEFAPVGASVGGPVSPDGKPLQCELPESEQQKNIASKGLGCCVFRSIDHAARWQNIPALLNFPEWMVSKGIEGGGYPQKVDKLIPMIAKDRGYPTPAYIQAEVSGAEAINLLQLAGKTGRMTSVTYSKSPTGRYGGSKIAHMVNAAHTDEKYVAILDNNYVKLGDKTYEWCSHDDFLRICNGGGKVWIVVMLGDPPPPPPKNL